MSQILIPPHGITAIRKAYGDPRGMEERKWRRQILRPVKLPTPVGTLGGKQIRSIWVHRDITAEVEACFQEMVKFECWYLVKTLGCYAWRPKRGMGKLSTHSWAIALDINARTNRLRTRGDMPIGIIETFVLRGWRWGGYWRRRDPMHFQFATGY